MTQNLKPDDYAAITAIESAADFREPLFRILDDQAFTPIQKGYYALIWTALRRHSVAPLVEDVARTIGFEPDELAKILRSRSSPFYAFDRDGDACVGVSPCLAYGGEQ